MFDASHDEMSSMQRGCQSICLGFKAEVELLVEKTPMYGMWETVFDKGGDRR
jgi:hypothetical protein